MSEQITRSRMTLPNVGVALAVADATEIPFEEFSGGQVLIPTGSGITSLAWYGAERQADEPNSKGVVPANTVSGLAQNFVAAYDATGNPITQTVAAGRGYPIPAALQGYAALKATGNAAGNVIVCLKS